MIQSVASQIIGQFGAALKAQLAQDAPASDAPAPAASASRVSGDVPPPAVQPAKPISGISLLLRALWDSLTRPFRKKQ
jgi:hypothetical protein